MAFSTGFFVKFNFNKADGVKATLDGLNWDTGF